MCVQHYPQAVSGYFRLSQVLPSTLKHASTGNGKPVVFRMNVFVSHSETGKLGTGARYSEQKTSESRILIRGPDEKNHRFQFWPHAISKLQDCLFKILGQWVGAEEDKAPGRPAQRIHRWTLQTGKKAPLEPFSDDESGE